MFYFPPRCECCVHLGNHYEKHIFDLQFASRTVKMLTSREYVKGQVCHIVVVSANGCNNGSNAA